MGRRDDEDDDGGVAVKMALRALGQMTVKSRKDDVRGRIAKGLNKGRKIGRGEGRRRISKAGEWLTPDLATGGLLNDEQQNSFIRTMIEQSQMLQQIRTIPMKAPTRKIERIAFVDRLLKPATEFTPPASSTKPTTAKLLLETHEFMGLVTISYDTLQDSLEGGINVRGNPIERTIRETMAEAVARDVEYYAINSDTASADPDLDEFDGALKAASGVYDHGGAPVDSDLFKGTLLSLPKRFRQDKKNLMYFYGPNTDTEWRDELGHRGTDLGDRALSDNGDPNFRFGAFGIPILQVTQFPEELGAGGDKGKILLTDPRNAIVGFWRKVFFDWDKSITERAIRIAVSVRFGFQYEDPDGAARGEEYTVE